MTTTANIATRLENILGVKSIFGADEELREYAVDGVVPKAIAKPKSSAEVV